MFLYTHHETFLLRIEKPFASDRPGHFRPQRTRDMSNMRILDRKTVKKAADWLSAEPFWSWCAWINRQFWVKLTGEKPANVSNWKVRCCTSLRCSLLAKPFCYPWAVTRLILLWNTEQNYQMLRRFFGSVFGLRHFHNCRKMLDANGNGRNRLCGQSSNLKE